MRFLAASGVVFAVAAASWLPAPPLPSPRSAHAVVATAGAVFVLGGPTTRAVDRYDGRHWQHETTLPGGVLNAPSAVAVGTRIYVVGGFEGTTNLPTPAVRVFDTASKRWSSARPLPAPRGGAAAVVLDGLIHVLGGGNQFSTIPDHSVYDPRSNTWAAAAPLPRPEGSVAAVALDGRIYAIGGRSGLDDYGSVYVYDPSTDHWRRGPDIPARGTAGAVVWHGSIYLFGGESQRTASVLGDVYRLAPGATAWRRVATMPVARSYPRAVVYRDRILIVGGSPTPGSAHSTAGSRRVDVYRP